MKVTIVVPCYNEEQRLPKDEFRLFPGADFLFVNDGSSDGTLRLLESMRDADPGRISVLNLEKNSGKAEAVRQGILNAMERKDDLVGFWDADLATPLNEIPLFLEIFEARPETEMVFAARVRLLGRNISRRAQRHYIGRIGATLIS